MRVEATQESPTSVYPTPEEESVKSVDEFKTKLSWNANNFVLGAFDTGQLVGIAGLRREPFLKLCHTAIIWGVYVKPKFRGEGIAKKLVAGALDIARSSPEVCQVKLCVHTQNSAAKRVYVSNGFETYGIERGVIRIGEEFFDEDLMMMPLR
jgi:ribosomal protein S18 acetylase RimI-like enzyme